MQEILMKTNSSRMVSPFTIVNANLYSIVQYRIMQVCFKFTVIIYNRPVLSTGRYPYPYLSYQNHNADFVDEL